LFVRHVQCHGTESFEHPNSIVQDAIVVCLAAVSRDHGSIHKVGCY